MSAFIKHRACSYAGLLSVACLLLLAVGCSRGGRRASAGVSEDTSAKRMLQGVWVNDDDGTVAFRAKGDTIYYADSASTPAYFRIVQDTLVLSGASTTMKYRITKQAAHLFVFTNQNGETVRLKKSNDPNDLYLFEQTQPRQPQVNQQKTIRRDTVIVYGDDRYHGYVQVNPTSYKVIKASYNDEGVEVDNVYYDNIVNLTVYRGAQRLFSHDFRKRDFARYVPRQMLSQCVLSDIAYRSMTPSGIHFAATLAIPDTPTSYVIDICISFRGEMSMKV